MKRVGILVAVMAGAVAPWSAHAQCTVPAATTFSSEGADPADTPLVIPNAPGCVVNGTIVSSQIEVTGAGASIADINVTTALAHPCTQELQMMLTSPSGRVVTLFSNQPNAFCEPNEFQGTIWDDDADPSGQLLYTFNNNLVTDRDYATQGAPATRLAPEEPLGAFIGENPNGTWTLSLVDQCNTLAGGTLNSWSLSVAAGAAPTTAATSVAGADMGAITDGGSRVFSATVTGAGTFLTDLNVLTSLTSTQSPDIQMTIKSPQNTFVTLTTANGNGADNFNGTQWDDQANVGGSAGHPIVGGNNGVTTDTAYLPNNTAATLAPEEGLGAFYGEDPNGVWQLTIADRVANASTNNLSAWSLNVTSATCPTPTPTSTGTVTPQPTTTPGPPTPTPTPTVPFTVCNGLPASIVGTSGSDVIVGSDTDDVIHGLQGDDVIKGRLGSDMICGGAGNDVLRGNQGDDLIKGGGGNDILFGGKDRDVLLGGKGDDVITGGDDEDTCLDEKGSNAIDCENVN